MLMIKRRAKNAAAQREAKEPAEAETVPAVD
jgi:hypothetical protein